MSTLQDLIDDVTCSSVDLFQYGGGDLMYDAAFEIISAESALVGIADQFLSKTTPSSDQLLVLDMNLMEGTRWMLTDGRECDLANDRELLHHARLLVSLQGECRRVRRDA
jgi:hypothetical protein